jgi:hypothetical protein
MCLSVTFIHTLPLVLFMSLSSFVNICYITDTCLLYADILFSCDDILAIGLCKEVFFA